MQWRSDRFLSARILLYLVTIFGGIAMANYAMNSGHVGIAVIAFVLAVVSLGFIGGVERWLCREDHDRGPDRRVAGRKAAKGRIIRGIASRVRALGSFPGPSSMAA